MDWLFLVGTAAFSVSGYLLGVKKRFDMLGVLIVALLTAIGGGVIRDVLLNRIPIIFFDASSVWVICAALLASWAVSLHKVYGATMHRVFIVADSVGLIAFSLAGADLGIDYGFNLFGVLFVGFVTAIGGGIVRDMMVNDVPFILHKDVYGTVSILVAGLLYAAHGQGWQGPAVVWGLFSLGLAIRLVAHWRDFRLPQV
ncbi:trimeric intracellular cation channel family protein [Chitinimonas arctica]|uniref:Trimeric intracellular cation channel family protein n=2 Tax=Chitinimonas arctica TaxID=2594795 RepID=A0A516SMG7_9NEIS|nr:trimeric intracellular cation channel family protein [Chitinimonas arctica]